MARHLILLLLSALLVPETTAFRKQFVEEAHFEAVESHVAEEVVVEADHKVEVQVEVQVGDFGSKLMALDATQHPDFSGHYVLDKVEGQPDHAAYNAGVGWVQRQAAYAASYGAGTLTVDVTQSGNHFNIHSSTPLGSSRVQFNVGGGRQHAQASDGGRFDIQPVWRGNEIRATMWRGSHVTHIRRFMRGRNMIIESTIDGYYNNAMTREIYKPRN